MSEAFLPQEYPDEPRLRDLPRKPRFWPRILLLAIIRLYQKVVAPGLPANTCRFYPSCSHYGYQAIYKHGAARGALLATWRIVRCNPLNAGGYDPIP
ncbi:MAG: membrane protein insertion efficiency factor YidD [Chloroflexi bacterium]|nr:membrane protein insertion efficiency factor YidD [Chloroflexota bacterium]